MDRAGKKLLAVGQWIDSLAYLWDGTYICVNSCCSAHK